MPCEPSVGLGRPPPLLPGRPRRAPSRPGAGKRVVDAVASLEADGHQALVFAVLGHKADLGVMALGPDLARLQAFQQELLRPRRSCSSYSYVSLTELSEYTTTEDDERARLASEEGLDRRRARGSASPAWRERIAHYREQRLHPQLPREALDLLLPDVEAARRRRQLVRAAVRGAQGADGGPRPGRPHVRGPGAAAHHRLDRARRLGVGRHAARRRPGRAEGDRLRDALRPGVGALRRVRSVLHRPACSSPPTRCDARRAADGGRGAVAARPAVRRRSPRSSSTGR